LLNTTSSERFADHAPDNTINYNYGTIEQFNVDLKAECGQFNLAHVTKNKKYKKKKLRKRKN